MSSSKKMSPALAMKKQGTLFSFFTKKSPPPSSSSSSPSKRSPYAPSSNKKASSSSSSSSPSSSSPASKRFSANKSPPPSAAAAAAVSVAASDSTPSSPASSTLTLHDPTNSSKHPKPPSVSRGHASLLSKIVVGTRVAVYWPDDRQYYPAKITGMAKSKGGRGGEYVCSLLYDDGEAETVDMATERFRIIGGKTKKRRGGGAGDDDDDDDDDEDGDRSRSDAAGAGGSKRRRIQEDDDDDDDDNIFDDMSDDGGGDETDGSAFVEGEENDDDDDDDDALMVTDDDDDDKVLASFKKRKNGGTKKSPSSSSSSSSKKKKSASSGGKNKGRTGTATLRGVKVTSITSTADAYEDAAPAIPNPCSDDSNLGNERDGHDKCDDYERGATMPSHCDRNLEAERQTLSSLSSLGEFAALTSVSKLGMVNSAKMKKQGKEEEVEELLSSSTTVAALTPTGKREGTETRKKITPSPLPERTNRSGAAAGGGGGTEKEFRTPPIPEEGVVNPKGTHWHNHLTFVFYPRDANGRPPDHPEYDPRTLRVDKSEIMRVTGTKKLPPAKEQWWDIKSQYADAILLFKTGKFYEIFHMDADVCCSVLDINYMKGCDAHCGFPEAAYGTFSGRLVRAGLKVARVEQTETMEAFQKRKDDTPRGMRKPIVMCREVCSVSSAGTRTFCYLDDARCFEQEGSAAAGVGPLLAIRETVPEAASGDGSGVAEEEEVRAACEYGVAIVDAVRGVVTLGQFADDVLRSRMDTLLTTFDPSEILVEGGPDGVSPTLLSLLKSASATAQIPARIEKINSVEHFPKSTAVDPVVRKLLDRPTSTVKPWDVEEALHELHRRGYYPRSTRGGGPLSGVRRNVRDGIGRWPEVLKLCVEAGADLALSAFGAALFYLQRGLIDREILGMGVVKAYVPPGSPSAREEGAEGGKEEKDSPLCNGASGNTATERLRRISARDERREDGIEACGVDTDVRPPPPPQALEFASIESDHAAAVAAEASIDHMSLDGTTIANLEILANSHSNTSAGSLWSKIDRAKSPHGSRLLRAWLLRPLFRKADIDRRADAVQELASGGAAVAMSEARPLLAQCGDIERLLSRVHSMGQAVSSCVRDADGVNGGAFHPNERAVLYETATHTKRKVGDFGRLLKGLRAASSIPQLFAGLNVGSTGLLSKIVRTTEEGGFFPADLGERLDWFFDKFDLQKAERGEFEPVPGMDDAYDEACDAVRRIESELVEYLEEVMGLLRLSNAARQQCKYVNTKHDSKDKYLIELPMSVQVPADFEVKGQRKKNGVIKYRTPVVNQLVSELEDAIESCKAGKARSIRSVFARFDSMRPLWAAAAQATAMLDALGALADAAAQPGYARPVISECGPTDRPLVRVTQGRHPCVEITHGGGEFVPNDLALGGSDGVDESRVLLLSGPNMGGKSTLLRQTCLIIILAQIGCFVPADECVLTPIDRIFTRLGASDRILLGQSTFFVELAETAAALRGATRRSLVIMDELGRGTSTFDGTAIASATVKHLIQQNRCIALFATHYHSLLEDWRKDEAVRLGHMECFVEGGSEGGGSSSSEEDNSDAKKSEHNITFLYTLGKGSCPKSFGINVARLAALSEEILSKAKEASTNFENEMSGLAAPMKVAPSNALALTKALKDALDDEDALERLWNRLQ